MSTETPPLTLAFIREQRVKICQAAGSHQSVQRSVVCSLYSYSCGWWPGWAVPLLCDLAAVRSPVDRSAASSHMPSQPSRYTPYHST